MLIMWRTCSCVINDMYINDPNCTCILKAWPPITYQQFNNITSSCKPRLRNKQKFSQHDHGASAPVDNRETHCNDTARRRTQWRGLALDAQPDRQTDGRKSPVLSTSDVIASTSAAVATAIVCRWAQHLNQQEIGSFCILVTSNFTVLMTVCDSLSREKLEFSCAIIKLYDAIIVCNGL